MLIEAVVDIVLATPAPALARPEGFEPPTY